MPALPESGFCGGCDDHADRLTGARLCGRCAWRLRLVAVVLAVAVGLVAWGLLVPARARADDAPSRPTVVLHAGEPAPWDGFLVDRSALDRATVALETAGGDRSTPSGGCPGWSTWAEALAGTFAVGALAGAVVVGGALR